MSKTTNEFLSLTSAEWREKMIEAYNLICPSLGLRTFFERALSWGRTHGIDIPACTSAATDYRKYKDSVPNANRGKGHEVLIPEYVRDFVRHTLENRDPRMQDSAARHHWREDEGKVISDVSQLDTAQNGRGRKRLTTVVLRSPRRSTAAFAGAR